MKITEIPLESSDLDRSVDANVFIIFDKEPDTGVVNVLTPGEATRIFGQSAPRIGVSMKSTDNKNTVLQDLEEIWGVEDVVVFYLVDAPKICAYVWGDQVQLDAFKRWADSRRHLSRLSLNSRGVLPEFSKARLLVQKLREDAIVPMRVHAVDAGLDLYSCENVRIRSGERAVICTGIATAIPEGHVGLVWDRSGNSFKRGLKVMGGVVDSGYRGEIKVCLHNLHHEDVLLEKGYKIAQMLIQEVTQLNPVVVDCLPDSDRGERGFGSSD